MGRRFYFLSHRCCSSCSFLEPLTRPRWVLMCSWAILGTRGTRFSLGSTGSMTRSGRRRPFEDYLYFSARIRWAGHEIEWLHDKVYMGYDTPDVQGFNISDGYNFVLYNIVQKWAILRVASARDRLSCIPRE